MLCPILKFYNRPKCFFRDCLSKQLFDHISAQSSSNFNFLTLAITHKHLFNLWWKYKASELRYSFKFNGTILHIWFRSKFDSKKLLTLLIGTLLLELTLFEPNESALEVKRANGKFWDNPGHNSFELSNVLAQVRLATSKTKIDTNITVT